MSAKKEYPNLHRLFHELIALVDTDTKAYLAEQTLIAIIAYLKVRLELYRARARGEKPNWAVELNKVIHETPQLETAD